MLSFSERLRELRKEGNLTQKKVAAAIGVSERGYIDLENGKSKPKYGNAIALALYFDVSLDYLLGRTDDMAAAVFQIQTEAALSDNRLSPELKCVYLLLCRTAINGRFKIMSEEGFCERHSLDKHRFYNNIDILINYGYISIGKPSNDESPGTVYVLEENLIALGMK
ncbi:MAG: helix-turn-helix domain-containing protein [Defluviitaleaceae bacterium]|nr:helix-turn-helix domain-containing protein [Defluviitaleaceae bacterium]